MEDAFELGIVGLVEHAAEVGSGGDAEGQEVFATEERFGGDALGDERVAVGFDLSGAWLVVDGVEEGAGLWPEGFGEEAFSGCDAQVVPVFCAGNESEDAAEVVIDLIAQAEGLAPAVSVG